MSKKHWIAMILSTFSCEYESVFTQTGPADQRRGRERACARAVYVTRILHQKRRVLLERAGHSDVINTQKTTASERNIPRRVDGEHDISSSGKQIFK